MTRLDVVIAQCQILENIELAFVIQKTIMFFLFENSREEPLRTFRLESKESVSDFHLFFRVFLNALFKW